MIFSSVISEKVLYFLFLWYNEGILASLLFFALSGTKKWIQGQNSP